MQFETPQFIEIDDKIFGPLTWKQFLYVFGGGIMTLVLFFMVPFIVFLLIGVPIAALSAALAFYPINNRPFENFLEAMFNYFSRQRLYHWQQKKNVVYRDTDTTSVHNPILTDTLMKKRDISAIARRLEIDAIQKKQ